MAIESILTSDAILESSSIVENAPYVMQDQNEYTTLYSRRCRSCRSKNCVSSSSKNSLYEEQ